MSQDENMYSIQKNRWGPNGRLNVILNSLSGKGIVYFVGILALFFEAACIFTSPVIIKLTIDSILGTHYPMIPPPMKWIAEVFLGSQLSGGGLLRAPQGLSGEWLWRSWFRDRLWLVGLVFVFIILLQSFCGFIANYCANTVAEKGAKSLRDRLFSHIHNLPYETLLRIQTGDWLQRCTSDVDTSRRFIASELFEMIRTIFLVLFAYPVMWYLSPSMTLWGSVVLPVIVAFSLFFHRVVERVFLGVDEREGILAGIVQENITGVRVVRAFARQEYETARFDKANNSFRDQVFKLIFWLGIFWGVSSFLGIIQIAIVLGAGLHLMSLSSLTLGLLVLFISYEHHILWPLRQFGRILADMGKTKVALGRIAEILYLPAETELDDEQNTDISSGTLLPGDIEFEHVSFTYPDGTAVLHDVSFTMKRGEILAIIGPTGSGKSSLVHLLLRLYEPDSGRILLNGRDIRDISKRTLRRTIALVLQESFLYGKTVQDNIRMGRDDISEEEVKDAARKVAFHDVAEKFKDGYSTMVGERGVTLSGGQKQRLALARALARNTPLLILDDSLSAVDTETEHEIRSALRENIEGQQRSILLISHRLSTVAVADHILVLEKGVITQEGSHSDLVLQEGLYRRLSELQSAIEMAEEGCGVNG